VENKIAEIIDAGTTDFTAECYELYKIPALGSLVKTIDSPVEIFAVVCYSSTTGIEPGRRPIARGKDETTPEAVYQSNPQLLKLLRSEFQALVVGFKNGDKILPYLPPAPARIHGFVLVCSPLEIAEFSRSFEFLTLLIKSDTQTPPEELIAATMREMSRVQPDPQAFLIAAGKKIVTLLSGDYRRTKAILGRLSL